ncbi:hypothetical protein ABK040_006383 [Willaertia magna]
MNQQQEEIITTIMMVDDGVDDIQKDDSDINNNNKQTRLFSEYNYDNNNDTTTVLNLENNDSINTIIITNDDNNNEIKLKKRKMEDDNNTSKPSSSNFKSSSKFSLNNNNSSFEVLFFKHVINNNLKLLTELIEQHVNKFDINMIKPDHQFKGQTALHIACNSGYSQIVSFLLDKFPENIAYNISNSKGSRPIHFAAYGGHFKILKLLLAFASKKFIKSTIHEDLNENLNKEQEGIPFFFEGKDTQIIVTRDNAEILHELINCQTNDDNQRTPLIIATEKGHSKVIKFILEFTSILKQFNSQYDASSIPTANGYLAIHKAASRGNAEIVEMLIQHRPETLNAKTSKKKYPLYFAVKKGRVETVETLLRHGACATEHTPSGKKLIHIAAYNGLFDICKLLVEHDDCDINATTSDGHPRTALHLAAKKGNYEIVKLLIEHGANVEAIDYFGRVAIHVAASAGCLEVMNVLANVNGKDYINYRNSNGISALHFACASGHVEIIDFLKKRGFNFDDVEDERGIRPIYVAAAQNQAASIRRLLRYYRKDLNYINHLSCWSPLHIAIIRDSVEAVEALLEYDVDLTLPSGHAQPTTPLQLAKNKNNSTIISMLNTAYRSY